MGLLEIIGAAIVAILAAFGGRMVGKWQGKREGRKEAETDAREKDYRNADDIRRRARDADGVHIDPDAGYRD